MAIRKSASSGIPSGLNAGRPANPTFGQLYSNGETARLEIYTQASGWQNIVQETPGVASASGTYNESAGSGTFTVSGTNFVDGAIAYAVGTNGIEYQATSTTYNSLVQLTTIFSNLSVAYEPYDIKIVNPSNLFGLLPDAFYINDSPVWSTAAGSLGSYPHGSVSIQLASTDDESNSRTYSIASGSLPTGLSLSSSGLISGTSIAEAGAYSFVVSVNDGSNAVSRSFSITSTGPVVTGGTLSSDSTYYYRTFKSNSSLGVTGNLSADTIVLAGGGAGGNHMGGGGGAGGLLIQSSTLFATGSYTVTFGSGGSNSGSVESKATSGVNSSIIGGSISMSAIGGGAGGAGNISANQVGSNGGSGGGNSAYTSSGTVAGTGTNQQGNNGGTSLITGTAYLGTGGGGYSSAGGRGTNNGNNTWTAGVGGSGHTLSSGYASASGLSSIAGGGGGGSVYAGYEFPTFGGSGADGGGNGAGWQSPGVVNGTTTSGTTNSGGGGGAARYDATNAGNGGSGMVIFRYTKASVGG